MKATLLLTLIMLFSAACTSDSGDSDTPSGTEDIIADASDAGDTTNVDETTNSDETNETEDPEEKSAN